MPRYSDKELADLLKANPDAYVMEPGFRDGKMVEAPVVPKRVNEYPEKRTNKYGNRKVTADGHTFDSAKEYRHYTHLRRRLEAGEITSLQLQPRYVLLPAFTDTSGNKHRRVEYIADFEYFEDGKWVVEDVKSPVTARNTAYRIKVKLFLYKYGKIVFREIV